MHACLITTSIQWLIFSHGANHWTSKKISRIANSNKKKSKRNLIHTHTNEAIRYSCDCHRTEAGICCQRRCRHKNHEWKYYRTWNPRNYSTWRWYIPLLFEHFFRLTDWIFSQFLVYLFIYFFSSSSAWYMNAMCIAIFSFHSYGNLRTHTHNTDKLKYTRW